jgi:flavin-binding protein dodecin
MGSIIWRREVAQVYEQTYRATRGGPDDHEDDAEHGASRHASHRPPWQPRNGDAVSVYSVIEIIGTSSTSWEEAAAEAIKTAGQHLRELRVAEVVEQDIHLDEGRAIVIPSTRKPCTSCDMASGKAFTAATVLGPRCVWTFGPVSPAAPAVIIEAKEGWRCVRLQAMSCWSGVGTRGMWTARA